MEQYSCKTPWSVYALDWSNKSFRLGAGSFITSLENKIRIYQVGEHEMVSIAEADHQFPITKLKWSPTSHGPDIFATTADYFRLWELVHPDDGEMSNLPLVCKATLANIRKMGNQRKEYSAPLTSFDWNSSDPSLCVTSSIDTTCTVWDIESQQAKTQLIAHDKEVFDVAFSKGIHVFSSVGADGSVRMFDLRSLEHSTIIYETGIEKKALLRVCWNKQDSNYLATFMQDSPQVIILDIRVPAIPVAECFGGASISSIQWAPHSSTHICSTGDDGLALVWDIGQLGNSKQLHEPLLAYTADEEICNSSWSSNNSDWIAISQKSKIQALRI